MKFLIWASTGLVALLWTLMIAVMASLANWLAGSTTEAVGGLQTISQWPMPAWLSLWVDPVWLEPLKAMMAWVLDLLTVASPWLAPVLGWVAPLLWFIWAVVMLLMLAIASGGHVLLGKLRPPSGPRP